MDSQRFDALTRALTDRSLRSPSRRALVRAFGGGLVALGLAAAPAAEAKKPKKCKKGLTRCGKKCVNLQTDPRRCGACTNAACAPEIPCVNGTCQCRDLGAACVGGNQCCSGRCALGIQQTCRKLDCVETGACASDLDCCNSLCVSAGGGQACCDGIC